MASRYAIADAVDVAPSEVFCTYHAFRGCSVSRSVGYGVHAQQAAAAAAGAGQGGGRAGAAAARRAS